MFRILLERLSGIHKEDYVINGGNYVPSPPYKIIHCGDGEILLEANPPQNWKHPVDWTQPIYMDPKCDNLSIVLLLCQRKLEELARVIRRLRLLRGEK